MLCPADRLVGAADKCQQDHGCRAAAELTRRMAILLENESIRAALASLSEDKIIFDLAGIEERYDWLTRELPGVAVRFAMKSCPVDEVLACLANMGAGFDVASPNEMMQ